MRLGVVKVGVCPSSAAGARIDSNRTRKSRGETAFPLQEVRHVYAIKTENSLSRYRSFQEN
jgi:hypothetical protein